MSKWIQRVEDFIIHIWQQFPQYELFVGIIVLVRVGLALLIWVMLFLGLFLGYFTFPVLLVGVLFLIYAVLDLGLLFTVRRQEKDRSARQEFLQYQQDSRPINENRDDNS